MLTHRQKKIYPNNIRFLISSPKPWEVWNDKTLKSSKEITAKKFPTPGTVVKVFVCPPRPATLPSFWKETCHTDCPFQKEKLRSHLFPYAGARHPPPWVPSRGGPHKGCWSVKCIQSWLIQGRALPMTSRHWLSKKPIILDHSQTQDLFICGSLVSMWLSPFKLQDRYFLFKVMKETAADNYATSCQKEKIGVHPRGVRNCQQALWIQKMKRRLKAYNPLESW